MATMMPVFAGCHRRPAMNSIEQTKLWIQRSDERFFTGGTRPVSWDRAQLGRYEWASLRIPQILPRTFGVMQVYAQSTSGDRHGR